MKKELISHNGRIVAIIVRDKDWEKGLNFVSSGEDYLQVGFWGYDKGQKLAPHIHLEAVRSIERTQEALFVKSGRLKAHLYNEQKEYLTTVDLFKGDTVILLSGGHGYEVVEDNTRVLEIKNGPYVGADKDRERI